MVFLRIVIRLGKLRRVLNAQNRCSAFTVRGDLRVRRRTPMQSRLAPILAYVLAAMSGRELTLMAQDQQTASVQGKIVREGTGRRQQRTARAGSVSRVSTTASTGCCFWQTDTWPRNTGKSFLVATERR